MSDLLCDNQFDFITRADKDFIRAFDGEMARLGYDFGGKIGSGYCWGRYMLIYTQSGVKSKKVFARIYIRTDKIVLRMYFNDIDKHRVYIENSPSYIKGVFTGGSGDCQHCHNDQDGQCRFRKTYTIDNHMIEKCNGVVFEFHDPTLQRLPDYTALFTSFYPQRMLRSGSSNSSFHQAE